MYLNIAKSKCVTVLMSSQKTAFFLKVFLGFFSGIMLNGDTEVVVTFQKSLNRYKDIVYN